MKVYFISGLAADRAVFRNIRLPEGFEAVYIDWLAPRKGETLAGYALRMAAAIDTSRPFGLLGLSMGGMMVTEIAKHTCPQLVVLISSIPLSSQLPPYYRWLGRTGMHNWVPIRLFQQASLIKRLFTTESREDKEILREMIRRADPQFIRWAMGAILSWQNDTLPGRYIHIHGTADELLPIRYTKPTHRVRRGGHLMIMNRAAEINGILSTVFAAEQVS
jgi:pimeloyl-ACP methyl ester carboxylesterase